eukprot:269982-Rhodomonas_salina.1
MLMSYPESGEKEKEIAELTKRREEFEEKGALIKDAINDLFLKENLDAPFASRESSKIERFKGVISPAIMSGLKNLNSGFQFHLAKVVNQKHDCFHCGVGGISMPLCGSCKQTRFCSKQ